MRAGRPQLVPAIEAETVEQLIADAAQVAPLAHLLHYDVADGNFVASSTPRPVDFPSVAAGTAIFWHLMVHEPASYLNECLEFATDFVAVAAESEGVEEAIAQLSLRDIKTVLSLSPPTRPRDVAHLIDQVAGVQIMTIEPGGQGRPLEPTLLGKLAEVRVLNPTALLCVDGGANVATIEAIVRHRPDFIAVGSALTRAESVTDAWRTLNRLVDVTMSKEE